MSSAELYYRASEPECGLNLGRGISSTPELTRWSCGRNCMNEVSGRPLPLVRDVVSEEHVRYASGRGA
jgi:hypothetical protein